MRNFMRKIYLNEKNNTSFVILIIFNIIFCFWSYYIKLQEYVSMAGGVITVASFFGISIYQSQQKNYCTNTQKDKFVPREIFIERSSWFDEIIGKKGIVLLTGVSGIGKTYLLNQLQQYFDKNDISYYFENSNYFRQLDKKQILDKEYVILDQYERALVFDNIDENISVLKNLNDKNIIISVRKEYLADIYKLLDFDISIHLVWLDYSKNEVEEIKDFLQEIARKTAGGLENNWLYAHILKDVSQGNLSMIQLSFLAREIQYKEEEYVIDQLKKHFHIDIIEKDDKQIERKIYDYDDVIMNFCREQIDVYENSETVYLILFLLCLDRKGQYTNTIKDFQNISIQSEEKIIDVIDFLFEHKWIKRVKENENIRSKWTEPYEIAHDYLQILFDKLCKEQIAPGIRNNIEYYNENCQIQRESEEKIDSWRAYTNKVCKKFLEAKSKIYVNGWLLLVAIFLVGINEYLLSRVKTERDNICITLVALNFMVSVSIYYMYNYYYYFLTIFHWRYFLGIFLATPVTIFSFLCMDYWAVSLGCEIIVVGSIMGLISFRVRKSEKKFFRARCFIFCAIGLIVTLMGFFFKDFTHGDLKLALPLFALYSIYIATTVIVHINRPYILEITGKVLYGGRRQNIK